MSKIMDLSSEPTKSVTPVPEDILVAHSLAVIVAHDTLVNDSGEPLFSLRQLIQLDPVLEERTNTMAVTLLRTFGRYAKPELVKLLASLRNVPEHDAVEYAASAARPSLENLVEAARKLA